MFHDPPKRDPDGVCRWIKPVDKKRTPGYTIDESDY